MLQAEANIKQGKRIEVELRAEAGSGPQINYSVSVFLRAGPRLETES